MKRKYPVSTFVILFFVLIVVGYNCTNNENQKEGNTKSEVMVMRNFWRPVRILHNVYEQDLNYNHVSF